MPHDPITEGYDEDRWMRSIEALSLELGKDGPPIHLCLIGSAICLFSGMSGRTTRDLDIWEPASDFDLLELGSAACKAGLLFNPRGILEPDMPYLQLVQPGIVQVGEFKPVQVFKTGRLVITRPPVENIIAAKLSRADAKDIEDIQFLIHRFRPDMDAIRAVVASFPRGTRETAKENLIYLDIFQ